MVTSTKVAEDKVVMMSGNASAGIVDAVPPRTLLEDVNAHLTCVLCRGYYIDATTIVECLHSFCRSCIVKHLQTKKYCPVCEMMINAAKPNIKPDKALQDIVYKLVPGLFQREMERRRQFYSSRPGTAASTTPEQRGEDTERIIFSPEDVISFSLEYAENTDADSVSSRSSESGNEAPTAAQQTRRFLQCPAVVNISHLKKFISMKFDIDCSQFCIEILYKRVPLLDYYTLMDIAYIYNWKRNEPMRFFYQIIDYTAIRNRFGLFDINRKGSHFRDRKQSPASMDDTNAASPAQPLNDHSSDGTSGTNSPMPEDCASLTLSRNIQLKPDKNTLAKTDTELSINNDTESPSKSNQDVDVEKSQFLNSFELKAKNNSPSPIKSDTNENSEKDKDKSKNLKIDKSPKKIEESTLKRKISTENVELKKQKTENVASAVSNFPTNTEPMVKIVTNNSSLAIRKENSQKSSELHSPVKSPQLTSVLSNPVKQSQTDTLATNKAETSKIHSNMTGKLDQPLKRTYASPQNSTSPKKKLSIETTSVNPIFSQKITDNTKSSLSREEKDVHVKKLDISKTFKKIPDLKLNVTSNLKSPPGINRGIRTDFLANNSDPIQDRSKILSQVKKSLFSQNCNDAKRPGDPLKSLFDSCKINIPSSLSITLTDQKLEPRNDVNAGNETKSLNKIASSGQGSFTSMKSPTPAVQNSIEILKLPDLDTPKTPKVDALNTSSTPQSGKSSESSTPTSGKGPVPSLKPISDTKLGKPSTFSKPSTTFHQIFIQSLQSQSEKAKQNKNKAPVPKLMPANVKSNIDVSKNEIPANGTKSISETKTSSIKKSESVLDLSTPSQLGSHQAKLLETMQSITNLAKKQNFSPKPNTQTNISNFSLSANKPVSNIPTPLRIPVQTNQNKQKPLNPSTSNTGPPRLESIHSNKSTFRHSSINNLGSSVNIQNTQQTGQVNIAQSSPRQTRSPSVSPKLVIAEDKQSPSSLDSNQSNQISSSQIQSSNITKTDPTIAQSSGQPKPNKVIKSQLTQNTKQQNLHMPSPSNKTLPNSGHSLGPGADMLRSLAPQILAQQQALQCLQARQQFEMQNMGHILPSSDWINKFNQARHLENLYKSLSNVQQSQSEFISKNNTSEKK